jgi:hypothetical protein
VHKDKSKRDKLGEVFGPIKSGKKVKKVVVLDSDLVEWIVVCAKFPLMFLLRNN